MNVNRTFTQNICLVGEIKIERKIKLEWDFEHLNQETQYEVTLPKENIYFATPSEQIVLLFKIMYKYFAQ